MVEEMLRNVYVCVCVVCVCVCVCVCVLVLIQSPLCSPDLLLRHCIYISDAEFRVPSPLSDKRPSRPRPPPGSNL